MRGSAQPGTSGTLVGTYPTRVPFVRGSRARAVVRAGCAGGSPPSNARRPRDLLGLLVRRVHELAAGLADHGVAPGDRVALLVPPGPDLTAAAHACWRAGASVVVADPGLAAGLARALRGAHPAHVVGALPGLALAAALGVPQPDRGGTGAAGAAPRARVAGVGWPRWPAAAGRCSTPERRPRRGRAGRRGGRAVHLGRDGPAKGVVYRHRQASAQIAALRGAYGITGDDRLVAAFPPFALYDRRWASRRPCRRCGNRAR